MKIPRCFSILARIAPLLLLLSVFTLCGWAFYVVNELEGIPEKAGSEIEVTVLPGQSAADVASEFARSGIVTKSRDLARQMARLGIDRRIKPGIYRVRAGRARDVALEFAAMSPLVLNVRILPGALFGDVASSLGADGEASLDLALASDDNFAEGLRVILPGETRERVLLLAPETYEIPPGEGAAARLVKRASDAWWLGHSADVPPGFTSEDMKESGILASIVQKEALIDSDRPVIAGVFKNRLSRDMPLQSCATVVYAWRQRGVRIKELSYEDVKIDSPFNTYEHKGLPPENIGIPSAESWRAALKPAVTDMLFFFARGDGRHVFTRTYEEHLSAQRKIRSDAKD
ncbi:MAG: endolytic transglycosylase MltG [Synergistaceae bacterium]|nr:endolytic transglycosylase MltG [Synergistaceae bacterium]